MSDYVTRERFSTPVDPVTVAADWQARGYSCHDFNDPPGQQWNGFVHRTNELLTVVDGRLRLLMAGETLTVDAGDEVFIPRDVEHSVHNVNGAPTHWLFGYD